jgi:outer membrane protein assembly factor BamB
MHRRHPGSGDPVESVTDQSSTQTAIEFRRAAREGLLTCLQRLGAALGVMALSYGSVQAAGSVKSTGNWSQFGFVPSGGRYNPSEQILNTTNVSALKVLWSAPDSSDELTSPAIVNGIVYTGSNAFEAATGRFLWSAPADSISPAVAKNTVYLDTRAGLCAYTAAAGTSLWCAGSNNYPPLAPSGAAVANGIAYYGTVIGNIYAIDAATGVQLWSAPISRTDTASSPAVANGVVYINGDELFAFNAKTGAPLWSSSLLGGTSAPAVVGGVVYASGNILAALNATTGAVIWSRALGTLVTPNGSPSVAKGTVYIGAMVAGQHGSSSGMLFAINAHSGKTIWSASVPSAIYSAPAVANGVVYVGTFGGTLYAFNAKTGAQLASVAGVAGESSPTVANGMVFSESVSASKIFALGVGSP